MKLDMYKTKRNLNDIYSEYCMDYKRSSEASYKRRLKELKPNDIKPVRSGFFYADDRDSFEQRANGYRDRAIQIIDKELQTLNTLKHEPTADDVMDNINSLRTKKDLSESDVWDAFRLYAVNYESFNALKEIAEGINKKVSPHIYDELTEGLERTRDSVMRISIENAERGQVNDTSMGIFRGMLNSNIPNYTEL